MKSGKSTRRRLCPKCKSDNVRAIVYGYPSDELMKEAEEGRVILGGCVITDSNPAWCCQDCGNEWGKAR